MSDSPVASHEQSVVTRYKDAYRVASALTGIGGFIKVVGFLIAGLIIGGTVLTQQMIGPNPFVPATFSMSPAIAPMLVGALLAGGLLFLLFWVIGVVVSAQGQLLRAAIDAAVNTSPFLTNDSRATVMNLA